MKKIYQHFHFFSILLFTIGFALNSTAQAKLSDPTGKVMITPPDAAAFTQYSKIPVNQFTGVPNIEVPLYNIKVDNFDLPITLSYYAKGVQPNVHAGWVGTGWSLLAGGMITRKVNGMPDEQMAADNFAGNFYGGASVNLHQGDLCGWYRNHTVLNTTAWSSEDYLLGVNSGATGGPLGCGTAGILGFGSNSGTVNDSLGYGGSTWFKNDAAADEFDFNVGDISGAFFMGTDGIWHVRSDNGTNITVKETIGKHVFKGNSTYSMNTTIPSTFTQFILTTGDGAQYIFGGNDTCAIEFNRYDLMVGSTIAYQNMGTIATSWRIKEIILPSGKIISFDYFRDGMQYQYNPADYQENSYTRYTPIPNSGFLSVQSPAGYSYQLGQLYQDVNVNICDPVYLKDIVFPKGKLIFNSSIASDTDKLESGYNTTINNTNNNPGALHFWNMFLTYSYQIVGNSEPRYQTRPMSKWHLLNDIELDDYTGKKLKDIKLTYFSDANTRNFLSSVQEFGYFNNAAGIAKLPYTFTYNNVSAGSNTLPPYCSHLVDHWGYYNGHTPSYGSEPGYSNSRAPNSSLIQTGILTKYIMPTGGWASFQYEPNKYIKWIGGAPLSASQDSMSVTTLSQEAVGGGLRVSKITLQSDASSTPVTYEYSYVNDLTNNVCSGVLGMPLPRYFYSGSGTVYNPPNYSSVNTSFTYSGFSSSSIFPSQNDDGNIVTYSHVIERQSNNAVYNGRTETTFTNHDNGYGNKPPDGFLWWNTSATDGMLYHYNDRSFERGKVLTEINYDASGNIVKKVENTYNNDASRFNSYVPSILADSKPLPTGPLTFFFISAVRNYTFYPYLKQTVETDYPTNHGATGEAITTIYTYDPSGNTRNLVKKVVVNSRQLQLITNNRYARDFTAGTSDAFSKGITNLQAINANGLIVESYNQIANSDGSNVRTTDATLNFYNATLPLPDSVYGVETTQPLTSFSLTSNVIGFGKDPSYKPQLYLDNYDPIGNILQAHKVNDMNVSYQWGYNNQYPVAKVLNATNSLHTTTQVISDPVYGSIDYLPPNPSYSTQTINFTTNVAGTIGFNLYFGSPTGVTTPGGLVSFKLTGPNGFLQQSFLCAVEGNCGSTPSSISFANTPAGQYQLQVSLQTFVSQTGALHFTYYYPQLQTTTTTSGFKGFFYEGFEAISGTGIVSAAGHTGMKYWSGSYTPSFTIPDSRSYLIQWWSLSGSKWQFHQQPYSGSTALSGSIDDIRIFPTDASMNTYTYIPLIGMSSEIDPKGNTIYYEYDAFGRLKDAKDKDGNVIKKYDYHYLGQ